VEENEDDRHWIVLAKHPHPVQMFERTSSDLRRDLSIRTSWSSTKLAFRRSFLQMHSNPLHPPTFSNHQNLPHLHSPRPSPSFVTSANLTLPLRPSGFNPALLNPIQPSDPRFLMPTTYSPKLTEGPVPSPSHRRYRSTGSVHFPTASTASLRPSKSES
jgi:hypothetical protein